MCFPVSEEIRLPLLISRQPLKGEFFMPGLYRLHSNRRLSEQAKINTIPCLRVFISNFQKLAFIITNTVLVCQALFWNLFLYHLSSCDCRLWIRCKKRKPPIPRGHRGKFLFYSSSSSSGSSQLCHTFCTSSLSSRCSKSRPILRIASSSSKVVSVEGIYSTSQDVKV